LAPDDVPGNYPRADFQDPGYFERIETGGPQAPSPGGLKLAPEKGPKEPFADRYKVPGSTRVSAAPNEGYIAYAKNDSVRTINDAYVIPSARGKKLGQKNLVKLAKEAAEAGDTLNSDVSVTAAQLRAYEAAKKAGLIDFEYADEKSARQALKDGTIAKAGGKPVIVNIRPIEETIDVTS
jgi:hypothetical protein